LKNANLAKLNIPDVVRVQKHVSTGFVSKTKMNQMLEEINHHAMGQTASDHSINIPHGKHQHSSSAFPSLSPSPLGGTSVALVAL
jgi:hypothetical protein